ncbi:MAG: hypothetical protein QM537_04775 [Candidatus Symbiobacter sp.]|nr:hypothetical protein [Candidatus Symbiobacter sp.]
MIDLSLDLGAETEVRLAEYAAQCGTDVSAALRDAVHEAVRQLLTANLDDAAETYRPLGDPNEETLAAVAELNDPNRVKEKFSLDDFKHWMRDVKEEALREEQLESKHA